MSSALNPAEQFRRVAAPPPRHPAASAGHPSRTLAVAASGTALVMAVFSAFVVNVGDSVRTLHSGVAGEAWGLSGMSLGLAAALLTAGALADDLGHRRVLRCSAALLAAASAVGALAPSMEILVAARVLQGVAGGGSCRRRSHGWPTRRCGTGGGRRLAQWLLGRGGRRCGSRDCRGDVDRVPYGRKGPA